MKFMNEKFKEIVLEGISRIVGEHAINLANEGVLACAFFVFDEVELPKELIKLKKKAE